VAKAKRAGKAALRADAKAVEAVKPEPDSLPMRLLERFAALGDQPELRTLCGAVILGGLVSGNGRLARTGVRMLAAHTLATWTKDFVKHRVDRTRPRSNGKAGKDNRPSPGRSTAKEETSFPSGHSAGAAAVACAFARDYPQYAAPALAAGGALALAQIPRCAHYPTDVGAGLAIGVAAEAAIGLGARMFDRDEKGAL
jgi:membrane-associated phospholipid phosphatase